jgi:UDP-N-acetylmuramyl pentapeptide phosphotransferase/UDP-N-acetylglucosamine-1-phosphate transferase
MDGMNGKAGLFAVNALVFIILILFCEPASNFDPFKWTRQVHLEPETAITLSAITIASILGFLWFNCRTKALTFLGDCGSHLIGYLIAAVTFLTAASLWGPGPSMLAYTIVLMPFIYDVAFTLVKRIRERKSFWKAHREHLYQRLMIAGYGHMAVLRICAVTYVACGLLGLACACSEILATRILCLALSLLVMAIYTAFVLHRERSTTQAAVHE